jgi:protein SCO1/2
MKPTLGFFAMPLVVAALMGCRANPSNHATEAACCAIAEKPNTPSDTSLYQSESEWTSDQGKHIKLVELGGRPQVVVMFFASCQLACPIIVNTLQRIEGSMRPEMRARIGFTLVSFDTKRDTPAVLAAYRLAHALPNENWTLLGGEADDVLELAALLGLQFKEGAGGQFAHSNVITILNARGEIVQQQAGLNPDIQKTVELLQELASQ